MKKLVVAGNAVDGLEFYGPFSSSEEASDWADNNLRNEEWVVATILKPKE